MRADVKLLHVHRATYIPVLAICCDYIFALSYSPLPCLCRYATGYRWASVVTEQSFLVCLQHATASTPRSSGTNSSYGFSLSLGKALFPRFQFCLLYLSSSLFLSISNSLFFSCYLHCIDAGHIILYCSLALEMHYCRDYRQIAHRVSA